MSDHPFQVGQTLYRYDDHVDYYSSFDHNDYDHELGGRVGATCRKGTVERLTPKGAHVAFSWNNTRWISFTGRKRYAYPTKEEAWESFQIRKLRQIEHLERQLRRARAARALPQPDELSPVQILVRPPRLEPTPEQVERLLGELGHPRTLDMKPQPAFADPLGFGEGYPSPTSWPE